MADAHNFIYIWLKGLEDNYEVICGMYNKAMKEMFKQIPTTMTKALSPKQKVQKIMTEIGGGSYMENITKGLPPLSRTKLIKKAQDKEDGIKKNYMKLIIGGMIINSNYVGTIPNGLILKVKLKGKNPIQFLQKKH